MSTQSHIEKTIHAIVRQDPRYPFQAYLFMLQALEHTQKRLGRGSSLEPESGEAQEEKHVSGLELLEGVRDLAVREFGLMARVVFKLWGIRKTDDVGNLIFNLIEAELLSKTDKDTRQDFHNQFDLEKTLVDSFSIELSEVPWLQRDNE